MGNQIADLPGAAAVRRNASVAEPVFRGLGGERVATSVGGVPLYGACPARMDPPVSYLGPAAVTDVWVHRGLPSVTLGPPGLAGRIDASLFYARRDPLRAPEAHAFVGSRYDSVRRGFGLDAGVFGGDRHVDLRAAASLSRLDDYRSGDGTWVPATQSEASAVIAATLRLAPGQSFSQALLFRRNADVAYPSLPMDDIETRFWLYNAEYDHRRRQGPLERVRVRMGFALVDHLMTNERKSNRALLEASTPSQTRSLATAVSTHWLLGEGKRVVAGADTLFVSRDATRTRHLVMAGKTFRDHLWPDVTQTDVGFFAELRWRLAERWRLRVGLRGDVVASTAAAADDDSIGGLRVRDRYVIYYGDDAAETDRLEGAGAVQLSLRYRLRPGLVAQAGLGFSMRAAGLTERYFAFGPAPGGFQVGNPTLAPEKKSAMELGLRLRRPWLDIDATGYAFWVHDFILQTEVRRQDIDGDGKEDLIRGFQNVRAGFVGFEFAARLRPHRLFSVPLTVSYVWGRNLEGDRPLPEIPPLAGRLAVRYADRWAQLGVWAEAGLRFALRQGLVDERFPEDASDAWATLRLEVGLQLGRLLGRKDEVPRRLTLIVSLENLLDAQYHEHLMREAVLAGGGLRPGDEVPAPGRGLLISLRGEL